MNGKDLETGHKQLGKGGRGKRKSRCSSKTLRRGVKTGKSKGR